MIVHLDDLSFPGGWVELGKYKRVVFDHDIESVRLASSNERSDGTLARQFVPELNSDALVVPWHNGGTRMMVADGPIRAFGYYQNSDEGKITACDEGNAKGRLMRDAATADGDAVECSPYSNAD